MPQHRVLITGRQVQFRFGEDEFPVPTMALVNDCTVKRQPCDIVRYVQLFCDRHQLAMTSGLVSESFFPTQEALSALEQDIAQKLVALFTESRYHPYR